MGSFFFMSGQTRFCTWFRVVICIFSTFTVTAQNPAVSGKVYDSQNVAVSFADVVIKAVQDTTLVKASFTDEDGGFILQDVTPGQYQLRVSTVGFTPYTTDVTVADEPVVLQDIVLKTSSTELDNVVINQKRPVVKRKVDRLEFDVENSILSSDNAWEILKKTPGVNVGAGGLSIRGSNSILVTINDRKVYLTGTELRNLLENTNGDDIKSIEVITTPPARYEAQGSAVLNIKMKKNVNNGYKGSLAGAYVQTMYPKGVVSTNHYYKGNRFSVYGGYMFGSGHYYGESQGNVKYYNPDNTLASEWKSKEQAHYRATQQNSYNLTAEYLIDTLNTVTIGTNGFASLKSTANINTPTYIYDGMGQLDSLYHNRNHRNYPQKNNTINGSFEHKFNSRHRINLSSDYTQHYFNQDQGLEADFSLPGAAPYRQNRISSNDTRRIRLFSAQADYTGQAFGSSLEAGFRYGNVDAENDFDYLDITTGNPTPNLDMENRFLYDEDIMAGYVSMDREIGKWGLKAGLRGEHTRLQGNSQTTGEVNKQDYFKLFPTLYAMYKASDNHQIGMSYGKRIVRPQYAALNPFKLYNTPYAYRVGDPQLQPTIAHNLSVLYTLYTKFYFDFYYRIERYPSMEIVYQDYETNTIITQYTNIDRNAAIGMDFNTNLEIFPWWQCGLQTSILYREDTFQGIDGELYKNKKATFNGNTNNRFNLSKKKDLFSEVIFDYTSPSVQGTYSLGSISSLFVSLRKTFFEGNGELSLMFLDIYKGGRQVVTTRYANQNAVFINYGDTQCVRVGFRYRFGNQKLAGGRQRESTDEQRRL